MSHQDHLAMIGAGPAVAGHRADPAKVDALDPLQAQQRSTGARQRALPLSPLPPLEWPAWAEHPVLVQEPISTEDLPRAVLVAMMDLFPLGCLVRAVMQLAVPAPGTVGVVVGYTGDWQIKVKQRPDSAMWFGCKAEWLRRVSKEDAGR